MTPPANRDRRSGAVVWLLRLALAAGALLVALVAAELLLRSRKLPLSEAAARYVHGCYESSQPDRYIFASIRPLKARLHRPDFESDCYFLGYSWRHRSDGYGWRNPETWESADVLVLGDSIVYGHGVDEDQTVTHFLRELLGTTVVNMGITGGSPVHYVAYLRNFALPLEPKVVVVLFFGNDLRDVMGDRSVEQIERFVAEGKGREMMVISRNVLLNRLRIPGGHRPSPLDRLALYRLLDYHRRAWRPSRPAPVVDREIEALAVAPDDPVAPEPPPDEVLDALEARPPVAYLRKALELMAESTREAGAELVVGHIGRRTNDDWLLRRLLRESSAAGGFHYFETPVLEGVARLTGDGHLSEAGHRRLAEELAEFLRGGALPR